MNAETGNSIWRLLHAFADQYPTQPDAGAQKGAKQFLQTFDRVVRDRSYGCLCHSEWIKLFAKFPPPLDNGDDFQNWCVVIHDKINQKLGKKLFAPELSLNHKIFTQP